MSIGSNLFLKASLGVAPSCSLALLLTDLFPSSSYAVFNFIVNSFLLICEIMVEKRCGKKQILQLVLTFIYSTFIQITSLPLQIFTVDSMTSRVLLSTAACAVLAVGISFTVNSRFAVLPMEGFISSLSEKTGHRFGTIRIGIEILMTLTSSVFSLLLLGNLSAVGIGTVIAAFCTGTITNGISRIFRRPISFYLGTDLNL